MSQACIKSCPRLEKLRRDRTDAYVFAPIAGVDDEVNAIEKSIGAHRLCTRPYLGETVSKQLRLQWFRKRFNLRLTKEVSLGPIECSLPQSTIDRYIGDDLAEIVEEELPEEELPMAVALANEATLN